MTPLPRLLPGERVLWEGAPAAGLLLRPMDVLTIPFSLMWGGFALFWNVTVWTSGAPWFFRLWGLPFLLVGAYVVAGRFVVDAWLRRQQRYYVTSERLLIVRGGPGGGTRSLDIRRLPVLDMRRRADGSGDLRFGETPGLFSLGGRGNGWSYWQPALDPTPQFLRIPNVGAVHDLIERTARA